MQMRVSVSYTHLDVYKRQAYARLFFFGGGVGQDKLIKGIVFQNARAYAPSGTSHHGIRFAA